MFRSIARLPAGICSKQFLRTEAKAFSAEATKSANDQESSEKRQKHRIPVKRASKLLNELKVEEFERLKNGRQWPEFRAGDAIEIEKLPFMSSATTNKIKGVVIGISRKASDTNVKLLNVRFVSPLLPNLLFSITYKLLPRLNRTKMERRSIVSSQCIAH